MRRALPLVTALLLVACGTSPTGTTPQPTPDIVGLNGQVLDAQGKVVVGAAVTVLKPDAADLTLSGSALRAQATTAFQTTTDSSGRYHAPAPPGTYSVFVQAGDLSGAALDVVVVADTTVQAPAVTVTIPGTVTGHVDLAGGASPEGTTVFLNGTLFRTTVDASGDYTFARVPAGEYRVVARAPGFEATSATVTVTAGTPVATPTLTLTPVTVPVPVVSGFSPFYAARGQLLTLTGTHFGATRTATSLVTIGGVEVLEYVSWTDTEIKVRVASDTPLFTQTVTVVTSAGQHALTPVDVIKRTMVQPLSGGELHSLAVRSDSTVVAWGKDISGQTVVPAGLSGVIAVAAGLYHSLALRSDGTVIAWGGNTSGQTTVPAGLSHVMAVEAGANHTLALKSDGTVVAWGSNSAGQTSVPPGLVGVVGIAAGGAHSLAVKSDGTVVAWGGNLAGQTTVPAGLSDVVGVAAGLAYSLAVKRDGTVVAWGNNSVGQSTVPAGLSGVRAVTAGNYLSVALRQDGTVVAWGDSRGGQLDVPAGLSGVVAVTAGGVYSLALKGDGTVVAWGSNTYGQTAVPAGLVCLLP